MELGGCQGARSKIADITGIFAVSQNGVALSRCQRCEFGKEFLFAKIAAVVRIGQVIGVLELTSAQHANREIELLGQG